ncbi:MAG: hypothetical protein HY865_10770 [Chloroflexi bacterium]|nr:hypothetical protein [Chloroflexota bacterium]
MFRKAFLLCALLLTSCISVDVDSAAVTAGPDFVTSTLPPTKQGYVPPTLTLTPEVTISPTGAVTAPPNCRDGAVLLRDVTIQDNTQVRAGETFTKTWELQNVGTCPWVNYTLVFASGDKMDAPTSAPVPTTLKDEKVEVSVELTAPSVNGTYTGFFSLHNASDRVVAIGTEQTFWVKIIVGGPSVAATSSGTSPTQTGSTPSGGGGSANCNYTQNAGYVNQVAAAINAERAKAGLPALTVNSQLAALAQSHAADMACYDRISHTGSDGSSAYTRAVASGYAGFFNEEIIYGGGGPSAAMSWWMNDQIHRDAILKAKTTEMGVGYAYFSNGSYGDFIVVEFGTQ